jgi:hypothetical protein
MVNLRPYAPDLAAHVFEHLDPFDRLEAEAVRGGPQHYLGLFGDWHAVARSHIVSVVLTRDAPRGEIPFAVAGLANSGVAGVAEAAFLAANHRRHRFAIARAAVRWRPTFQELCRDSGISRVEARAWSKHPNAPHFLRHMGFMRECALPGVGRGGAETFHLYAATFPPES